MQVIIGRDTDNVFQLLDIAEQVAYPLVKLVIDVDDYRRLLSKWNHIGQETIGPIEVAYTWNPTRDMGTLNFDTATMHESIDFGEGCFYPLDQ